MLPYLGEVRDGELSCITDSETSKLINRLDIVNAIVLLTNGISFALQAVVLLTIGAWADYGEWRYVAINTPRNRLMR